MKFTFDKDAMLKEVSIAQEIISTKNALSILSNIYIQVEDGCATIKATDTKINFMTKLPVDIEEPGITTIFCDKFMGILNSLPSGDIVFEQKDTKVSIKPVAKKASFQLKSMASDAFPEFAETNNINYFELPVSELKEMMTQTIFSVSTDETRYFMTGVLFEKENSNLNLISTDGKRLSYISKNLCDGVEDFNKVIVPTKILHVLLRRIPSEGNISVGIANKMIFFKFGFYEFSSLIIEGEFPKYKKVIPESQKHYFEVEKSDLIESLKRVSLLVEQKSKKILLTVNPGVLTLSSPESDFGTAKEEIPCQYDDEEFVFALNFTYLDEPLKVMKDSRVRIEFSEEMRAITLRAANESDYFHIIMPMQKD